MRKLKIFVTIELLRDAMVLIRPIIGMLMLVMGVSSGKLHWDCEAQWYEGFDA